MAVNLYEAMFVIDAARGASAVPDIVRHIAGLLTRHEAQIERMEFWEERKLAYPIKKAKRGMYFLVYFRAKAEELAEIRNTVRLSEQILRLLILRAEEMTPPKGQIYSAEGVALTAPVAPVAQPQPEGAPVAVAEAKDDADESAEDDDEDSDEA